MCGIAGFYGRNTSREAFDKLFAGVAHRGPDASGVYHDDSLRMGMHRLKFRGADADLPVRGEGRISAYNGQLYGHFDEGGGYSLLAEGLGNEVATAWRHGTRADGMFALSIYSPQANRLVLRTDAHFIKPMFYRAGRGGVAFCSELGALLQSGEPNRLDLDALAELFACGWYLSDQTCIHGVSLVWRNDVALDSAGVELLPKTAAGASPPVRPVDEASIRDTIRVSVERSTRGIGPLGLALSGGLDSSILAWQLNELGVEDLVCVTVRTADGGDDVRSLAELGLPAAGAWRSWKHVVVDIAFASSSAPRRTSASAGASPTPTQAAPTCAKSRFR